MKRRRFTQLNATQCSPTWDRMLNREPSRRQFETLQSAANPPERIGIAEGYWLRHCQIDSFLGSAVGTESYFWSLVTSDPLATQHWAISQNGLAAGKYLFEGFRIIAYYPAADGDTWRPRGGTNGSESTMKAVHRPLRFTPASTMTPASTLSQFEIYSSLNTPHLALRSHASTVAIKSIVVPLLSETNVRVRYFRVWENGIDVTGIADAINVNADDPQTLRPFADVSATGWTGSPSAAVLADSINESPASDTEYIYSTADDESPYEATFDTMLLTGSEGSWQLKWRARKVDATGAGATGGKTVTVTPVLKQADTVISEGDGIVLSAASFALNTWSIEANDIATLTSGTDIRIEWRVDVSGASDPRGVAISHAELIFTPIVRLVTRPFGNNESVVWSLAAEHQVSLKKGVAITIDVWLEAIKLTGSFTGTAGVGTPGARAGYIVSHGYYGFGLTYNAEFDSTKHTYRLTFNGGTFRPSFVTGDVYEFSAFTLPEGKAVGTYGTNDSLSFRWDRETPSITLSTTVLGVTTFQDYIPDDNANAVREWSFSDNSTTYYTYNQTPGGTWNPAGRDTFVQRQPAQFNTSGTFSDAALSTPWPETITVQRIKL